MSWIIGTAVLWVLKLITIPFAKLLAGDRVKQVVPASPPPLVEADNTQDAPSQPTPQAPVPAVQEVIPTGYYILADVIIMGVAGGLLGLIFGVYFIGFSFKPKDWPGMIVFILGSLAGSLLHG